MISGGFTKANNKSARRKGVQKKVYGKPIVRELGSLEHKFYDTFLESHDISPLGGLNGGTADPSATSLISTPSQGDGAQNRDGKKIIIDTVIIEGVVQLLPRNVDSEIGGGLGLGNIFVALVLDTQCNGASPVSNHVWTNPSSGTQLACSPLKNLLFGATRFNTLKVWRIDMPTPNGVNNASASTISTQGIYRTFNCYLKVHIPVNFNEGEGTPVTTVVDNALHMYVFKNTTSNVQFNYNARIRFSG